MKNIIQNIINSTPTLNIAVIGDLCVDFYWDINSNITEKSLETGLLATKAQNPRYSFGGGANVIQNLLGLQNEPFPIGAISDDPFGLWLQNNLPKNQCGTLLKAKNYHTAVYCKPIIDHIEQPRIDFGNVELQNEDADKLIDIIEDKIKYYCHIIVINQQLKKGIHTEYFRNKLSKIIVKYYNNRIFITDARQNLHSYLGSIFKINSKAASMFAFNELGHNAIESGQLLMKKYNQPLIITDSINGCYLFQNDQIKHVDAIKYNGKIDAIGAGDTFTAGFAHALSTCKDIHYGYLDQTIINVKKYLYEAMVFANACSALTVRKLYQTGYPTKQELRELLNEL